MSAESIRRKLMIWRSLAFAAILESVRRKDLYVAVILAGLMIAAAALMGKFGVQGLEMFLKDVTLNVINLFSVLLAILFAARQIPEELTRRTVYPLLARPISRFDLIFGKFLGAFLMSSLGLILFAAIGVGALACLGLSLGSIFWQYLLLRFLSLALICAMSVMLSLLMTPSATVTLAILLAIGSQTFSQAILLAYGPASETGKGLMRVSYYVLPHLDLFDLSKKVGYGWKPIDAWVLRDLFLYAMAYTIVFLLVAALRFRRQTI
ncbi:MAG: ABC transporter permease subunit [Capsulimonadales bacterium]|nr:ABC transporter permease subunit [Capsulimonadales bacterium]